MAANSTEMHKKRVCIIGAGASGLAALRHVVHTPGLTGKAFEAADRIGGIWAYSDVTGDDKAPMYKNLRTNIPKEIMHYIDFPFDNAKLETPEGPTPSFVSHFDVMNYFNAFADKFKLWKRIKFNRKVMHIKPIITCNEQTGMRNDLVWEVLVQYKPYKKQVPLDCRRYEMYEFDAIMVCSGSFSYPLIPVEPNISKFEGKIMHSRDYRIPEDFTEKKVILVGRGPSGVDIALEIAETAEQVVLSSRQSEPHASSFPTNVRQMGPIKYAKTHSFVFENGEEIECDTLIWCTGYQCHFPFLTPECKVKIEYGKVVSPLYRHMIHTRFPSLCFIGIIFQTIPFLFFDCQVRYYVKYLEGQVKLPDERDMNSSINNEIKMKRRMNLPLESLHQLGVGQWEYFRTLAAEAGFNYPALTVVQKIYEKATKRRASHAASFKNDSVRMYDDLTFEYSEAETEEQQNIICGDERCNQV